MQNKILKVIFTVFLVVTAVSCEKKKTNEDIAKDMLTTVFTLSYECWPKIEDYPIVSSVPDDRKTILVENKNMSEAVNKCISKLVGSNYQLPESNEVLSRVGNLMSTLERKEFDNYTIKPKLTEIEPTSTDLNYKFNVIVVRSDTFEEFTISGSLQFNDEQKIDYISVQSSGGFY